MADFLKIKGMPELRKTTLGDSEIKIAVIDGGIDLSHPCFKGADIASKESYWVSTDNQDEELEASGKVHGTFISSVIFGQSETSVEGIAPQCKGEFIRFSMSSESSSPQLDMARAINAAKQSGANIIHISVATPTITGKTDEILTKAVQDCIDSNILIIAPAGNDKGECLCIPAALPGVLAIGALTDKDVPFRFSNWGGIYQKQGITCPGEQIKAAKAGGGTIQENGTSCAAPIVTGIAALLMSLQKQQGIQPNAKAVMQAILSSATVVSSKEVENEEERQRYLVGKLNIEGAMQHIINKSKISSNTTIVAATIENEQAVTHCSISSEVTETITPSSVENKTINRVFALGTLGYDFGSEARKDVFKQRMVPKKIGTTNVPGNPDDAGQMVDHFTHDLSETKSVIWTLDLELTTIYAIEGEGAFAREVYESFLELLKNQIKSEEDKDYIEKVCIPGILTGKTATLFSGQIVPVITLVNTRGIYGWKVNNLVKEAVAAVHHSKKGKGITKENLKNQLEGFLEKIYYNLRNLGTTAHDRALNYAATNAFQATHVFSDSIVKGLELDTITVQKSPFGRSDSDCWDVLLKFFNPNNNRHSKRIYRFTIDVSETMPVSIGKVRAWSTSN